MDWTAAWVTIRLAFCTTAALLILGLPLAYWAANTRRWWRTVIEASIALPILLPPTVLGFYLLLATSPGSLLGRALHQITGHFLPFSFSALLMGSIIYNLPFALRPFTSAFMSVDRRLIEASWCLGTSRMATFLRITFPLSWAGILTGIVLTFAHTVGEFGVVLMLGGDIPGATRTLSVSIFDDVQAMNYAAATRTSLILIAFAFIVLSLTYTLSRRVPHV